MNNTCAQRWRFDPLPSLCQEKERISNTYVEKPICLRTSKSQVYGYLTRSLGWLLEEIHVTWAHLEKKRTRLRLYTKSLKKLCIQSMEMASRVSSDGVRTFEVTASERGRPKETLEDFGSRD
ncbi:hypothetical protein Tco_0604646 [Tanacetum coccineum]